MNIAIIGRTQFLYSTAIHLLEKGHTISTVITAVSAPEYTKKEDDFKLLASSINAKFFVTKSLDDPEIISSLYGLDIGISVNWISLVKQRHIDHFKIGILNAHFGDLPRYRGNACPNWAILNGEKEIVLSIHLMEGGKLDCGRIIAQGQYPLTNDTYIGHIYKWGERSIPLLFEQTLTLLEKDQKYTLKYANPDSPESFRCYPRTPEDSRIKWCDSAVNIHRLIRATSKPFSGAYCFINGVKKNEKMIIWEAELFNDREKYCAAPGQISSIASDHFIVITGNGKLKITNWNSPVKVKSVRQRLL